MSTEANYQDNSKMEHNTIRVKEPKRILYFSDGTLEEYSSDEESDNVDSPQPLSTINVPSEWIPWILYTTSNVGCKTLEVCDSLGEYLADFFGITSPKYNLEIDYYNDKIKSDEMISKSNNLELNGHNTSVNA